MAAIDKHARELHAATTTGETLAECRADALADLILSNATVSTHLVVQVPVYPGTTAGAMPAGTPFEAGSTAGPRPTYPGNRTGNTGNTAWPPAFAHPITGLGTVLTDRVTDQVTDQDALDREFNQLLKDTYGPGPDADYFWELEGATGPPPDTPPPCEPPPPPPPSAGATGSACVSDASVPGIGIIPAAVIEALSRQFGTTISRTLVDATTGVTLETREEHYRPSPKLARFIKTRDQHCRFPGCSRPAQRCDIDHLIPWPQGPTAATNLHVLCRHHHRTKQSHGWTVTMTPQGVCTWTSPTGRRYTTTPAE
jgi:hypothetical protein